MLKYFFTFMLNRAIGVKTFICRKNIVNLHTVLALAKCRKIDKIINIQQNEKNYGFCYNARNQ